MSLFILTEQQRAIRDAAREFAKKELAPKAHDLDKEGRFPRENISKLAEMGFMGMMVDEKYGGSGLDALSYCLCMEEISAGCASTGVIMSVNNSLACGPIEKFGTEEQKSKYLPNLTSGKQLGCYALSEPSSGSDAGAMRTTAKREGNHYVINGTKNFITNGKEADVCILFAMTAPERKQKGITAFIVDTKTPGFSVGKIEDKMGIKASSTAQIHFDNMKIPEENRLGEEGSGFKIALNTLDSGRIGIASQALGIAAAAFEEACAYAKVREAFGKPIAEFQGLQWMIADMSTRLEAARLLTWRAASLKSSGETFTKEAAMAKLFASEMAVWVTNKAVQIHGGYGYMKEYAVERHFRDAKICEIYEGTSEIQRHVISRLELA